MEKEKKELSAEKKAAVAAKIVAILEREAGGEEINVLHTAASLLGVSIKIESLFI